MLVSRGRYPALGGIDEELDGYLGFPNQYLDAECVEHGRIGVKIQAGQLPGNPPGVLLKPVPLFRGDPH